MSKRATTSACGCAAICREAAPSAVQREPAAAPAAASSWRRPCPRAPAPQRAAPPAADALIDVSPGGLRRRPRRAAPSVARGPWRRVADVDKVGVGDGWSPTIVAPTAWSVSRIRWVRRVAPDPATSFRLLRAPSRGRRARGSARRAAERRSRRSTSSNAQPTTRPDRQGQRQRALQGVPWRSLALKRRRGAEAVSIRVRSTAQSADRRRCASDGAERRQRLSLRACSAASLLQRSQPRETPARPTPPRQRRAFLVHGTTAAVPARQLCSRCRSARMRAFTVASAACPEARAAPVAVEDARLHRVDRAIHHAQRSLRQGRSWKEVRTNTFAAQPRAPRARAAERSGTGRRSAVARDGVLGGKLSPATCAHGLSWLRRAS